MQARLCETQNKIPYPTKAAALTDLERINKESHLSLTGVYECGDHWHTTKYQPTAVRVVRPGLGLVGWLGETVGPWPL
jgi:hypothetical protein